MYFYISHTIKGHKMLFCLGSLSMMEATYALHNCAKLRFLTSYEIGQELGGN